MQSVTGGNHEIHERHETPSQSALPPTALPKGEPRTHTEFAITTDDRGRSSLRQSVIITGGRLPPLP
ncbi:MAG: hypothetical protein FWH14_03210 [Oscillospiraceae bacterium]|nr:hypothetical protein [Oscillospiraceae bacterium]